MRARPRGSSWSTAGAAARSSRRRTAGRDDVRSEPVGPRSRLADAGAAGRGARAAAAAAADGLREPVQVIDGNYTLAPGTCAWFDGCARDPDVDAQEAARQEPEHVTSARDLRRRCGIILRRALSGYQPGGSTWRRRGPWSRSPTSSTTRRWGGCRSASSCCAPRASFSTASTCRSSATSAPTIFQEWGVPRSVLGNVLAAGQFRRPARLARVHDGRRQGRPSSGAARRDGVLFAADAADGAGRRRCSS